ncbi:MAG: hypothetical protein JSV65_13660 [Armatimonadota bacterium]|nr:MAG: hypothetical protein JSV65_13660 [Armatimonadota bacterium]
MVDYSRDVYVHEGTVQVRPLGRKSLTRPIPPGECAIAALVCDQRGRIYGATSGRRAHLFRYDPGPMGDCVMRIGVIGEEWATTALAAHGKFVFGATGAAPGGGGWLFRYDTSRDSVGDYGYGRGEIEMLCQPLDGEAIAGIALDAARERIHGIGAKSGVFFSYDIAAGEVTKVGAATEAGVVSSPLIVTGDAVYGVVEQGRMFRFDLATEGLDRLDVFIPSLAGLEHYNRLDSAAADPVTGVVYGGTRDGLVFSFDPESMSFVALGKPVAQPGLRALTVGADGRVFGVGGDPGGMAHLFCYDPETRDLRDLGIPMATSERYWHGYEFGAACTGRFGEIYLGESDRISHLFIYHPPIKPRPQQWLME